MHSAHLNQVAQCPLLHLDQDGLPAGSTAAQVYAFTGQSWGWLLSCYVIGVKRAEGAHHRSAGRAMAVRSTGRGDDGHGCTASETLSERESGPCAWRAMTGLDRIIHEPARLLIVALLANVMEADLVFLLCESKLTRGNLSSHLAKLEEATYVDIQRTFQGKIPRTVVRLTEAGRTAFQSYRKAMRGLLQ